MKVRAWIVTPFNSKFSPFFYAIRQKEKAEARKERFDKVIGCGADIKQGLVDEKMLDNQYNRAS